MIQEAAEHFLGLCKESVKTSVREAVRNGTKLVSGVSASIVSLIPLTSDKENGPYYYRLRSTFRGPRPSKWMEGNTSSFNLFVDEDESKGHEDDDSSSTDYYTDAPPDSPWCSDDDISEGKGDGDEDPARYRHCPDGEHGTPCQVVNDDGPVHHEPGIRIGNGVTSAASHISTAARPGNGFVNGNGDGNGHANGHGGGHGGGRRHRGGRTPGGDPVSHSDHPHHEHQHPHQHHHRPHGSDGEPVPQGDGRQHRGGHGEAYGYLQPPPQHALARPTLVHLRMMWAHMKLVLLSIVAPFMLQGATADSSSGVIANGVRGGGVGGGAGGDVGMAAGVGSPLQSQGQSHRHHHHQQQHHREHRQPPDGAPVFARDDSGVFSRECGMPPSSAHAWRQSLETASGRGGGGGGDCDRGVPGRDGKEGGGGSGAWPSVVSASRRAASPPPQGRHQRHPGMVKEGARVFHVATAGSSEGSKGGGGGGSGSTLFRRVSSESELYNIVGFHDAKVRGLAEDLHIGLELTIEKSFDALIAVVHAALSPLETTKGVARTLWRAAWGWGSHKLANAGLATRLSNSSIASRITHSSIGSRLTHSSLMGRRFAGVNGGGGADASAGNGTTSSSGTGASSYSNSTIGSNSSLARSLSLPSDPGAADRFPLSWHTDSTEAGVGSQQPATVLCPNCQSGQQGGANVNPAAANGKPGASSSTMNGFGMAGGYYQQLAAERDAKMAAKAVGSAVPPGINLARAVAFGQPEPSLADLAKTGQGHGAEGGISNCKGKAPEACRCLCGNKIHANANGITNGNASNSSMGATGGGGPPGRPKGLTPAAMSTRAEIEQAANGTAGFVGTGYVSRNGATVPRDPMAGAADMGREYVNVTGQAIKEAGYPFEILRIVTCDGYVLYLERLPRKNSRRVAYLQHGLMDSSLGWVSAGVVGSQAFAAYDQGYDVFLGNFRGSVAMEHTNPKITPAEYWQYTINDHALHDIPAIVERIHQLKLSELTLQARNEKERRQLQRRASLNGVADAGACGGLPGRCFGQPAAAASSWQGQGHKLTRRASSLGFTEVPRGGPRTRRGGSPGAPPLPSYKEEAPGSSGGERLLSTRGGSDGDEAAADIHAPFGGGRGDHGAGYGRSSSEDATGDATAACQGPWLGGRGLASPSRARGQGAGSSSAADVSSSEERVGLMEGSREGRLASARDGPAAPWLVPTGSSPAGQVPGSPSPFDSPERRPLYRGRGRQDECEGNRSSPNFASLLASLSDDEDEGEREESGWGDGGGGGGGGGEKGGGGGGEGDAAGQPLAPEYTMVGICHSLGCAATLMHVVHCCVHGLPHRFSRLVLLSPAGFHTHIPFLFKSLAHAVPYVHPLLQQMVNAWYLPTRTLRLTFHKVTEDCASLPAVATLMQTFISLFMFGGDTSDWLGAVRLPHYSSENMPGVSYGVFLHFMQMIRCRRFVMFDYGSAAANQKVYGTAEPLDVGVNYGAINIPIDLALGKKDRLIPPDMVRTHYEKMKAAGVKVTLKEFELYAHLDFTFAVKDELVSYLMQCLAAANPPPPGMPQASAPERARASHGGRRLSRVTSLGKISSRRGKKVSAASSTAAAKPSEGAPGHVCDEAVPSAMACSS